MGVVLMAVFAGGNIAHNQISANAFSTTSLVMAILAVVSLIIVLLYVKDDVKKVEIEESQESTN